MTDPVSNADIETAKSTESAPDQLAQATAKAAVAGQAGIGQRVGACLIDLVIAMVVASVISFTIGQISTVLGILLSLVGYAYFVLRDVLPFLDGQSIGKKLLGLRAVTTQGESLSGNWSPGLIRNVVLLIPFFLLVELIILFTKQDAPEGLLRLGDQWAGTKVVISK